MESGKKTVGLSIMFAPLLHGIGFGQAQTASSSGRILDSSEAPVPDAQVTLSSDSGLSTYSVLTAQDGSYRFGSISAGRYEITVRRTGFAEAKEDLALNGGQALRADLPLRPAELNESITVTAEPGYVTPKSSTATKSVDFLAKHPARRPGCESTTSQRTG